MVESISFQCISFFVSFIQEAIPVYIHRNFIKIQMKLKGFVKLEGLLETEPKRLWAACTFPRVHALAIFTLSKSFLTIVGWLLNCW